MTPADKRMTDLLDKWLASLELHLGYIALSDAEYAAVQPWPAHDRPGRWIIELAKQRTLELKEQHAARIAMGDSRFAESLELMGFLANLVGVQHIERFIPLADPAAAATPAAGALPAAPRSRGKAAASRAPEPESTREMPRLKSEDATREMPRLVGSSPPEPSRSPAPAPAARPAPAAPKPARKAAPAAAPAPPAGTAAMEKKVLADAVRLLKWGKEWHELAETIARIADRPPVAEIRRMLRAHKAEIDLQVGAD